MIYLLTFACYGSHLHGGDYDAVDRHRNKPGTAFVPVNEACYAASEARMEQPPYILDEARRPPVLEGIQQVCQRRDWTLYAVHVRTNHVHVVIEAAAAPEPMLTALKAYASRRLNDLGLDAPSRKRWSRHGSTIYLWKPHEVRAAIRYILEDQGTPMTTYYEDPHQNHDR